jgi:hypothetical protein
MNTQDLSKKSNQVERILSRIEHSIRGIRYGSVTITIHDGRIVQIERIEKSRFDDMSLENGDGI